MGHQLAGPPYTSEILFDRLANDGPDHQPLSAPSGPGTWRRWWPPWSPTAKLGADLAQLERIGLKLLGDKQYHLVLVCGGINDLTKLNRAKCFRDIKHSLKHN